MLQSIAISDQKNSQPSIFNSLQSNGIVKSINLNSAFKSSNSKRLISEFNTDSCNNLQLSASSDNSRKKSYSMQSSRPTVTRAMVVDQSQIQTAQRQLSSETNEAKFVSLSKQEEIQSSKISEFKYENITKSQQNRQAQQSMHALQNKVTILIEENSKLITINENLMSEVEKLKSTNNNNNYNNNNSILIQSYQRETLTLQQTIKQYKQINLQQSQQIMQLQDILNQREEINNEQQQLNTNRSNQEVIELQSKLRLLNEQFKQLSCKYLLKCFELERVQQGESQGIQQQKLIQQKVQDKINVLIQENSNLNTILKQRLEEISLYQQKLNQLDTNMKEQQKQVEFQEHNYQLQQQDYLRQLNIYNETIHSLETEIQLLQQQITEHNYLMTRKNNDQIQLLSEVNKKYEMKNEEVNRVSLQLQESEQKWRQRCLEFEREMKHSYSQKLNQEIQLKIKQKDEELKREIGQYQQQNECLKKQNQDLHNNYNQLQVKFKSVEQQWTNEKTNLLEFISTLQQQISELNLVIRERQTTVFSSQFSSLGIDEKKQMIKENQHLNKKVMKQCQQIMNQRFQV